MLVNTFNPFDNLLLSSLIAAIPIVLFLLCLTVFKMKGIYAAITTLVVTLLIAIPFFKLPVGIASGAVVRFLPRYHSDWLYRYDGSIVIQNYC